MDLVNIHNRNIFLPIFIIIDMVHFFKIRNIIREHLLVQRISIRLRIEN